MPRGPKPGQRFGGRQKGTPNRVTTMIKEAAVRELASPKPPDHVDSKERMRVNAMRLDKLAGEEFQKCQGGGGNIKLAADLTEKAVRAWDKVAEYEYPKLAATTLRTEPDNPLTTRLEVVFVGGRQNGKQ